MQRNLLILAITAAAFGAGAQKPEFEFSDPELPVIQLCTVEDGSYDPVPFANISVEYADTIISSTTDDMGLLDLTPRSFPLTLTAACKGMLKSTYGLTEHPNEPLTIILSREPAEERKATR